VVATPIGNLADISARARDTLAAADLIAAEDTRHTRQLLAHLGIDRPLVSLHEHNELPRARELVARIATGTSVACVSDAGTPLISDPGYLLVSEALAAGLRVVPIPGPCAAITALSVAGLPTDRFCFEGFLPARAAQRRAALELLRNEQRTLVFYEAPHRLADCLLDLAEAFGGTRRASIARELTKLHESLYHDTLAGLAARAASDADLTRGEAVIVVAGAPEPPADAARATTRRLLTLLLEELPVSRAADLVARFTGARRNEVYAEALALRQSREPPDT
jgi:16S rRNA (cytidine1402-2'-O)-methyltransferase